MTSNNSSYTQNLPITQWSVSDRPREKYMAHGAAGVGDAELLAILLRTGSAQESAVELARRLLAAHDNSLNQLSELSIEALTHIKGVGKVKAVTLHAAFELGRRRRAETVEQKQKIGSAEDLAALMQSRFAEARHEEFWVVFVDAALCILKIQQVGVGGLDRTAVDVRRIVRQALELNAVGMFVCHNHPSGRLQPSKEDVRLTNQIKEAAAMFSIKLHDHVILHGDEFYSFAGEGMMM